MFCRNFLHGGDCQMVKLAFFAGVCLLLTACGDSATATPPEKPVVSADALPQTTPTFTLSLAEAQHVAGLAQQEIQVAQAQAQAAQKAFDAAQALLKSLAAQDEAQKANAKPNAKPDTKDAAP